MRLYVCDGCHRCCVVVQPLEDGRGFEADPHTCLYPEWHEGRDRWMYAGEHEGAEIVGRMVLLERKEWRAVLDGSDEFAGMGE